MKYTGALLAILIVPLVVIGGAIVIGLPAPSAAKLFLYAAVGYAAGTASATAAASSRKPDLSKGIDEHAITVYGVQVGASVAFGLGVLSFAVAQGWPVVGLFVATVGAAWFCVWLPPRFRTVTAECSIVINRDASAVFGLMSDFRTMVRWCPGYESVEMVTPEPIGPGTQFKESGHLPTGNPASGQDQIVDFEPNQRFSSTTFGAMKNLDVVTFESVGTGTRVSLRSQAELQLWMALIGTALFKGSLARDILNMREAAWARAKELLEGQEFPA